MHPYPCPKCRGRCAERRVKIVNNRPVLDAKGWMLRTECVECGAFLGYRPVDPKGRQKPVFEKLGTMEDEDEPLSLL
jgi:hypothetical protein